MNILVIDDNVSVQTEINSLLRQHGYSVTLASNGLDAYEKAQQEHFDLLIVDHLMPLMNGIQLIKNIRQLSEYDDKAIIFMTTQGAESLKNDKVSTQVNHIIDKPVNEQNLLSLISQFNKKNTLQRTL